MRPGGSGVSHCRLDLEHEIAAQMIQGRAVVIPERIALFEAAKFQRTAIELRPQVCRQDRGIAARETFVELLRFVELAQLYLISQSREIVEDNGELIHLQAILDDNLVRLQPDENRTIMATPRNG